MKSLDQSVCEHWQLEHSGVIKPCDLLHFAYLDEFQDDWESIFGRDEDDVALWALEACIMSDPEAGDVIPGTGGLRKLRFGAKGSGKRGGARVCYAMFHEHHIVLMVMAYKKNRKADLSEDEKKAIKGYLETTRKWLNNHEGDRKNV